MNVDPTKHEGGMASTHAADQSTRYKVRVPGTLRYGKVQRVVYNNDGRGFETQNAARGCREHSSNSQPLGTATPMPSNQSPFQSPKHADPCLPTHTLLYLPYLTFPYLPLGMYSYGDTVWFSAAVTVWAVLAYPQLER